MAKIYYNFVICLLILSTSWETSQGNTYDIPKWLRISDDDLICPQPTGQFNHPTYCDFFLNCWDGRAVVGRCHFGLVFNEQNGACDYRNKVDCKGRPISEADSPPQPVESEPHSQCPHSFGTFPDPGDCSQYIVCQGGIATIKKCPKGMDYYNSALGSCDSARPTGCPEIEPLPTPKPQPISESPPQPTVVAIASPAPVTESTSKRPPPIQEIPDYEIGGAAPEISAGGTPTLPPTTKRPQAPFRPKPPLEPGVVPPFEETPPPPPPEPVSSTSENPEAPFIPKPPFVPEKPPSPILEPPPPPSSVPAQETEPTNPPLDFSPKPPFVPVKPPTPSLEVPASPQTESRPKPPVTPEPEPEQPQESISPEPSATPPSGKPPTVTNLKPKPPLQPKPDEDPSKPPSINLDNLKPKPEFKPPAAAGQNPGDAPPPRPPLLRPELIKPQRPPGAEKPIFTTTPPAPIDGEDDPNILFPFLPKFPDIFKCPVPTIMLPLVGDCSSMIACIAGVGHRLLCPAGNTFDLELSRCAPTPKNFTCPNQVPNFIRGMENKDTSGDVVFAYLPVAKWNALVISSINQ